MRTPPITSRPPLAAVLALLLAACAGRSDKVVTRLDASDAELRDHVTALERSLDAAYDREKAMADRLRRLEESVAVLQARVAADREPPAAAAPPPGGERMPGVSRPPTEAPPPFDVEAAYAAAYRRHQERDDEGAVAAFAEIVERAPDHALADNAQYWLGECYYGLGRYRQALAAFTRVLTFTATEKDDDAQLMIARSYLALGEKDQAVAAFRRFLTTYPDSEYVPAARKELRYLEGP